MGVISGPVIGGNYGWPFAKSMLDVTSYGYEELNILLRVKRLAIARSTVPSGEGMENGRLSQTSPAHIKLGYWFTGRRNKNGLMAP